MRFKNKFFYKISRAQVVSALDLLLSTAAVDNRREIELLRKELDVLNYDLKHGCEMNFTREVSHMSDQKYYFIVSCILCD